MNTKWINFGFALMVLTTMASCSESKGEKKVAPVRVKTEQVGTYVDESAHTYVGEVEAESSTAVSFTSSGVVRVMVEEGQRVSRGQLIAEIDATQARNAMANSEAQMRQANDALARMKQLHDQNALPEVKWVETQTQVAQAKAQLDMTRKAVSDCRIYAPVSGVVGKKMLNSGETALPSQPVCTILNMNSVKVKVSVPEKDIARFSSHTPTEIFVEALNDTFQGGLIEKGVEADMVSRTYDVKIRVNNPSDQLLAGMVCNVKVLGGSDDSEHPMLTLPITSVQRAANGESFVWKAQEGKARRAKVEIGEPTGNRIEIVSGLKKGEKVIISGYQKLSEGSEYEE